MYHDAIEWYIYCMAILRGVIHSRSVTVILEYVNLFKDILVVEYLRQNHAFPDYILLLLA